MEEETKQKTNLKEKMILIIGAFLALIPSVMAYPVQYFAPDLYSVFVESVFGGFWLSVAGLAFVMFVIMTIIGGLSMWTTLTYIGFFILTMAIGYTQPLIIIPLWSVLMIWSVIQWSRFLNQTSGM